MITRDSRRLLQTTRKIGELSGLPVLRALRVLRSRNCSRFGLLRYSVRPSSFGCKVGAEATGSLTGDPTGISGDPANGALTGNSVGELGSLTATPSAASHVTARPDSKESEASKRIPAANRAALGFLCSAPLKANSSADS